jgi:hypothetical protein
VRVPPAAGFQSRLCARATIGFVVPSGNQYALFVVCRSGTGRSVVRDDTGILRACPRPKKQAAKSMVVDGGGGSAVVEYNGW